MVSITAGAFRFSRDCTIGYSASPTQHLCIRDSWSMPLFATYSTVIEGLPSALYHCTVITACDSTSGEVAAAKGIPSSMGISNILPQLFRYQLLYVIFQQVQRIPGYRNTTADALSRFGDHGLPSGGQIRVDWRSFPTPITRFTMPSEVDISTSFGAIERV